MRALRVVIGALKMRYPKVPVLTTDELQQLIKTTQPQRKLVLLDTREKDEFKVSRLANATWLAPEETDMSKVIKMIEQKGGPSQVPKTVVIYCAIGLRASIMSQRLLDELAKPENENVKSNLEVYSLEGAIFKWATEKRDLVDPDGNDVALVHPVNRLKGMLVDKQLRADAS